MTIEFRGIEFTSSIDAVEHAEIEGGVAILVEGKRLVVARAEAERLAAAGVEFAYVLNHRMPDDTYRIVHVPVND